MNHAQSRRRWLWVIGIAAVLIAVLAISLGVLRSAFNGIAQQPDPSDPAWSLVNMPDVVGDEASEAHEKLTALGLVPLYAGGEEAEVLADAWTIYAQDLPAGQLAGAGTHVILKVSEPWLQATTPLEAEAPEICDDQGRVQHQKGYQVDWPNALHWSNTESDRVWLRYDATIDDRPVLVDCVIGPSPVEVAVLQWDTAPR